MDGFFSRRRGSFKATLTVQANPSATITATSSRAVYTGTANATTGLVSFEIKKKASYTITTNNTGAYDAENNVTTVNVNKSGQTYTAQIIKINVPSSLSVGNYSSNALTAYFTRPSSNWTGVNLRRNTGSAPTNRTAGTSVYTGNGNTGIVLNNSSTVTGYTNTGLTANTTYYYSIFSYLTINGTNYWTTTYKSASGTAANYVGTVSTISSTQSWSVPTGWRTIQIFAVGGGGGGGYGGNTAGGGGGGYAGTSGNINVTPGTSYTATIGGGGSAGTSSSNAGGTGGTTSLGSLFSKGGGQGAQFYQANERGYVGYHSGGNGGSGGGAKPVTSDGSSYQDGGANGGSDGGHGGNSQYNNTPRYYIGGTGQGSTTKAWGNGTLYAGGGGGGGHTASHGPGSGGSGGGGTGAYSGAAGSNGSANTGGGGGGGWCGSTKTNGGKGGSGIMLIKCVA